MIPAWAATIWIEDQTICLHLPFAQNGKALAHIVRLPADPSGWSKANLIISSRHDESRLNSDGDPTQFKLDRNQVAAMADKFMKDNPKRAKALYAPELQAETKAILERMGLI